MGETHQILTFLLPSMVVVRGRALGWGHRPGDTRAHHRQAWGGMEGKGQGAGGARYEMWSSLPQPLRIALESGHQRPRVLAPHAPHHPPQGGPMFRTTTLLAATSLTGFAMVGLAFRFLAC
jgi:hypothetical protein